MALSQRCPACQAENDVANKFCTGCGGGLQGGRPCTHCGAPLKGGQKFCTGCGQSTAEAAPSGPGVVANGVWQKAPGEVARRVTIHELAGRFDRASEAAGEAGGGLWSTLFKAGAAVASTVQPLTVQVPMGCVALIVTDGAVVEILPPGNQTVFSAFEKVLNAIRDKDDPSKSLWERAKSAFATGGAGMVDQLLSTQLRRTFFYLVDRRPVMVPFQHTVQGRVDTEQITVGVSVIAHVVGGSDAAAKDALGRFLQAFMANTDSLHVSRVRAALAPHVERAVRAVAPRASNTNGIDLAQLEALVKQHITAEVAAPNGLRFEVMAAPRGASLSLDLHLGQGALPKLRVCDNADCGAEVHQGQKFCTTCGSQQPTAISGQRVCGGCRRELPVGATACPACKAPVTPADPRELLLATRDGEAVELDLVLRTLREGDGGAISTDRVARPLADAAARLIRGVTWAELSTAQGLARLQERLTEVARDALRALNLRLAELAVLDVKTRNGQWELGARTDLKRAQAELAMNKEWLALEGDVLSQEQATLALVLRRKAVQGDHEFAALQQQQADALRTLQQTLAHDINVERARTDAATQTTDIRLDAYKDEVRRREGEAGRDSQLHQINRTEANQLRDDAHQDALTGGEQDHTRQTVAAQQAQARSTQAAGYRREEETAELSHQTHLESLSAAHDQKLAEQALRFEQTKATTNADTQDYIARKAQTRALDDRRATIDLDQSTLDREEDRSQRSADRSTARQQEVLDKELNRQETALDAEARRQKEKLELASRIQAERQRLEAEQRANELKVQAETDQLRIRSQATMTAQQILATGAGRALTDAEAAALADGMASGNQQQVEGMKALLAEREASYARQREADDASRAREAAMQAQMMAMFQQMLDKQALANQVSMNTMAQNTAALAGANRSQADAVADAYKVGAEQARSMSERSMDTMANVAATASRGPQQVVYTDPRRPVVPPTPAAAPPPADPVSGPPMAFCGNCGTKSDASLPECPSCGHPRA